MSFVSDNLKQVQEDIVKACLYGNRNPADIHLIAVSKTFSSCLVLEAYDDGQTFFGESKLQEAELKIAELPNAVRWHFIGRVQRNKVRKIIQLFEVIHSVDSLKLASFINDVAKELGLICKIFVQINIGQEVSKGGFDPQSVSEEMRVLSTYENLDIQGLMCIPPNAADAQSSRIWFVSLRKLRDQMELDLGILLPYLSMGMSSDFAIAIEEGATHVRIGSLIFGNRAYRVDGELG